MQNLYDIRKRLREAPNDAEAHWKYGCFLAYTGRWEQAWPELEWRFKGNRHAMALRAEYPKPDWDGSQTRLLVYQDQGHGDLFQYCRYLPMVNGCEITLECAPEVHRLMDINFGNMLRVVVRGQSLPEYDHVTAVCSLPLHFRTIPAHYGYLKPAKTDKFAIGSAKKIGVAWAGNPYYQDDGTRSCPPEEFLTLSDCGELVSLMMVRKPDLPFTDFSLRIVDFADTAEIIDKLDAVVAVDTASAHLAGAMAKPVYLALSYEHDCRWMHHREDSPWYPTMKIFRQAIKGDWGPVFDRIKSELSFR